MTLKTEHEERAMMNYFRLLRCDLPFVIAQVLFIRLNTNQLSAEEAKLLLTMVHLIQSSECGTDKEIVASMMQQNKAVLRELLQAKGGGESFLCILFSNKSVYLNPLTICM